MIRKITERITEAVGSSYALIGAVLIIAIWLLTGPFLNFSDTWLLLINTITTIITFLMVFVIQSTQNRESKATQIKLDELIRAVEKAHNAYIGLEKESEEKIEQYETEVELGKGEGNG